MSMGLKIEGQAFGGLRELTDEDLAGLNAPKGSTTPPLAKLRTTHHNLARLMAEGRKDVEISRITGYSQSRLSILKNDPAFRELVHAYMEKVDAAYVDMHERLASLGMTAAEELQDRLEEDPTQFSNAQLLNIVDSTMDRTVAPKKSAATLQVTTTVKERDIAAEVAALFGVQTQAALPAVIDVTPTPAELLDDDEGI